MQWSFSSGSPFHLELFGRSRALRLLNMGWMMECEDDFRRSKLKFSPTERRTKCGERSFLPFSVVFAVGGALDAALKLFQRSFEIQQTDHHLATTTTALT
jgi:hypothetical protein